jgi:hypothetical protein
MRVDEVKSMLNQQPGMLGLQKMIETGYTAA